MVLQRNQLVDRGMSDVWDADDQVQVVLGRHRGQTGYQFEADTAYRAPWQPQAIEPRTYFARYGSMAGLRKSLVDEGR